jgi:uncharacterized protein
MDPQTEAVVAAQLGRAPRGLRAVAHTCPCGLPDVVETAPRLPDGTPFPTLYYLSCPRAAAAVSRLEAAGTMRAMTARLARDEDLRRSYEAAHQDYLARRDKAAREAGLELLPPGTQSAGGMPARVKCLHALLAHELAVPGVNPLGREAAGTAGAWWADGPCVVRLPDSAGPGGPPAGPIGTGPAARGPGAPGAAHASREVLPPGEPSALDEPCALDEVPVPDDTEDGR